MKTKEATWYVAFTGFLLVLLLLAGVSGAAEKTKKGTSSVVAEGKSVKVHYTLTVDGKVVDSSKGREPMQFKPGTRQMIPGFEKAVMGMKAGQKKSFRVSPDEGYGRVNSKLKKDVPKSQLPADTPPKAGMTIYAQTKKGQRIPGRIMEVKKDMVVIDFNHPLAGKTLHFDVEVIEIK